LIKKKNKRKWLNNNKTLLLNLKTWDTYKDITIGSPKFVLDFHKKKEKTQTLLFPPPEIKVSLFGIYNKMKVMMKLNNVDSHINP